MLLRLDKILADTGRWSRKEARELIRAGRVRADGTVVSGPETRLDPDAADLTVDGAALKTSRFHYFMLHKPAGVLSATEDRRQSTVLDLLGPAERRMDLFPVGRLDKDTTGLLLLTDDGPLAHKLLSPKYHVPKVYLAEIDGRVGEADIAAFAGGMTLEDGTVCRDAALEDLGEGLARVTLREGKYHQVKRMLAARGKPVTALHREKFGPLTLDPALSPGSYRALTGEEQRALESLW